MRSLLVVRDRLKREVVLGREDRDLKAVGLLRWVGRRRMQCRDRMHVFRRCAQSPLPKALVGVKFSGVIEETVGFCGERRKRVLSGTCRDE